jgi:hypothetical protein
MPEVTLLRKRRTEEGLGGAIESFREKGEKCQQRERERMGNGRGCASGRRYLPPTCVVEPRAPRASGLSTHDGIGQHAQGPRASSSVGQGVAVIAPPPPVVVVTISSSSVARSSRHTGRHLHRASLLVCELAASRCQHPCAVLTAGCCFSCAIFPQPPVKQKGRLLTNEAM